MDTGEMAGRGTSRKQTGPHKATFACHCGAVRGTVGSTGPGAVNRVVCYCDDCQAFAHWLGRSDLLDQSGGSDIVQLAPASMAFTDGETNVAGIRLSPRGLFRFYTSCCHTPVGNMVGTGIPFVGVVAQAFFAEKQNPDSLFGPPIGAIKGEYAVGTPPAGSKGMPFGLMARAILKVLSWRMTGRAWPHPFFDRSTGKPNFPVTVVAPEDREQLRLLCGPRPMSQVSTRSSAG
ncbi:DUF6151 family protein [Nostoc sp. NIES-2111]